MLDQKSRNRIDRIRAGFAEDLDSARSDPHLSDDGRVARITALYEAARSRIEEVRAGARNTAQARRGQLERSLFGLAKGDASAAISARDAADRVATIKKPEELAAVMQRAAATGDDALERAGLRLAIERSSRTRLDGEGRYAALVEEYMALHPGRAEELREYLSLVSAGAPNASFAESVALSVPRPPEVGRKGPALSTSWLSR